MQNSERPSGNVLTIYQIANDQWAHAEQLRWTVLYNFLVANTILLLGWAAVFAINASSSTRTATLVVFSVAGLCVSLGWLALGIRASGFVRHHATKATELEAALPPDWRLFGETEEYRRRLKGFQAWITTRQAVKLVPLVFLIVYLVLLWLSLRGEVITPHGVVSSGGSQMGGWVEIVVPLVTAVLVAWYAVETTRLRRETVRQTEIALRPAIVPIFEEAPGRHILKVKNVGNATAFNVRIQTIHHEFGKPNVLIRHETQFNPIDFLEKDQVAEVRFQEYSNGKPTDESVIQNKFFPTLVTSPTTVMIFFDNVEGGSYESETRIEPPTQIHQAPALQVGTNIKNVTLVGIRRRAR